MLQILNTINIELDWVKWVHVTVQCQLLNNENGNNKSQ